MNCKLAQSLLPPSSSNCEFYYARHMLDEMLERVFVYFYGFRGALRDEAFT